MILYSFVKILLGYLVCQWELPDWTRAALKHLSSHFFNNKSTSRLQVTGQNSQISSFNFAVFLFFDYHKFFEGCNEISNMLKGQKGHQGVSEATADWKWLPSSFICPWNITLKFRQYHIHSHWHIFSPIRPGVVSMIFPSGQIPLGALSFNTQTISSTLRSWFLLFVFLIVC